MPPTPPACRLLCLLPLAVLACPAPLRAAELAADRFVARFLPFSEKHCARCHNQRDARGELDLSRFRDESQVAAEFRRWNHVIEFIRDAKMPPEDEPQPTLEERRTVVEALEAILLDEARKHAGDPGLVPPRRLSNTEYDRSVRDLTGVDIRPTRDFPPDPAGGEGFDNTGEALGVSPNLLKKYLAAAQHVSEHLVLKTDGIAFAPFPVNSYNERKKLTEQAIIDFYQAHAVGINDYLEAAWRYRHRGESDSPLDLDAWAARHGLSRRYLALIAETLDAAAAGDPAADNALGHLGQLGRLWRSLPAPGADGARPPELAELERWIAFCQRTLGHREEQLIRSNAGNWPIAHLAFRARTAAQRDQFDPGQLRPQALLRVGRLRSPRGQDPASQQVSIHVRIDRDFDDGEGALVLLRRPLFSKHDQPPRNDDESRQHEVVTLREILERHHPELARRLAFGTHPGGAELDADSLALRAPMTLEIPLGAEALRELDGKQLLLECVLDDADRERSVRVQASLGDPPADSFGPQAELLAFGDSKLAQSWAASAGRLCRAFPNRFYYVDDERGLAAGFHLVDGFFRDDRPLVEKVLDDGEREELDHLWRELDFVTQATETLLRGFVWFERSERHVLHDKRFDFLRSEDPKLVEDELLTRFEREYLEKLGVKLVEGTTTPQRPSEQFELIHGFFDSVRTGLARDRDQLHVAEGLGLEQLERLAERAYRRPLGAHDRDALQSLYESLRHRGQGVEASLRGTLVAVLMSPDFFFHGLESTEGVGVRPLGDDALASRLSYFLWSSLPDDALLAAAHEGRLRDADEVVAQTRRMLRDPRIDGFAREFLGQWLRYRDYLAKDPINAEAFPGYDEPLREAMFEEPTRLAIWLIQEDRPITDLLNSDITFVNGALAKHYGGELERQYRELSADPSEWRRVSGLRAQGRGGLFGMGVVLTKTSKGERTSPVKRGFWTVHHLLGEHFPPPPANVPELPKNEREGGATLRELVARHVADPQCAMCHVHFDGLGIALEGFDPIGRARSKDLADRPIDDLAEFPGGGESRGVAGLIDYVERQRRQDFVRNLCRKFLGYALGRSVLLTDEPLLLEMESALAQNEHRFSVLFETVVRSPQFRQRRGAGPSQ